MSDTIELGNHLIPLAEIALVEPFDPDANPDFQVTRPFQARVVLLNRDSALTEEDPVAFAEGHNFLLLTADGVAINPGPTFRVERFEASEGFTPRRPYASRLRWRDRDGNDQSKLLLTQPDDLLDLLQSQRNVRPRRKALTVRPPTEPQN